MRSKLNIGDGQGLFVVIEGADGAGKTTISHLVAERLNKEYELSTIYTREPGSIEPAEKIREVFKKYDLNDTTRTFLTAATRNMNVNEIIIPALRRNKIVICDRFLRSTYIYQNFYRQLDGESVYEYACRATLFKDMMDMATEGLEPDIEFILEVSHQVSYDRCHQAHEADALESSSMNWYERISKAYKDDAELDLYNKTKVVHINVDNQSIGNIVSFVLNRILQETKERVILKNDD